MTARNIRIQDVIIGNQEYRITFDNARHFPIISQLGWRKETGALAAVLEEITGKPQLIGVEYLIENDDELMNVIIELGWKFSRRKQWKRIFDHYSWKYRQANQEKKKQ